MNVFNVTLSSQTLKSNSRRKTLMSIVDPGKATISVVPTLLIPEGGGVLHSCLDNAPGVRLVTSQEAASEVPIFLPSKRGLRLRTGRPILTDRQHTGRLSGSQYIVVCSVYILYVL